MLKNFFGVFARVVCLSAALVSIAGADPTPEKKEADGHMVFGAEALPVIVINAPPREYAIETSRDYELCVADAVAEWKAEREEAKRKSMGWDPNDDNVDTLNERLKVRIDVRCHYSTSDIERNGRQNYTNIVLLKTYDATMAQQANERERSRIKTYSVLAGYGKTNGVSGGDVALGGSIVIPGKISPTKYLLHSKDGLEIVGTIFANPKRDGDKVSILNIKIKSPGKPEAGAVSDEYTLDYDAGLNMWYFSRALGMRGTKVIVGDETQGERTMNIPWVGEVELGAGQSNGVALPFLRLRAGVADDGCILINNSNHGICADGAVEAIGGFLQLGLEAHLGIEYMYKAKKLGSKSVVKIGPKLGLDLMLDTEGGHDSSQIFFGATLNH